MQGNISAEFSANIGFEASRCTILPSFPPNSGACDTQSRYSAIRCTIFHKSTQILAYADDVDIVGRPFNKMETAFLYLGVRVAEKVGLKVNEIKTKSMRARVLEELTDLPV